MEVRMKVKELLKMLNQYGENTNVYVKYNGFDLEIENGDTFKIKDIEDDFGDLVLKI